MLKPDDARAQLSQFKSQEHETARRKRLQKLPKAAAAVGLGLFHLLPLLLNGWL